MSEDIESLKKTRATARFLAIRQAFRNICYREKFLYLRDVFKNGYQKPFCSFFGTEHIPCAAYRSASLEEQGKIFDLEHPILMREARRLDYFLVSRDVDETKAAIDAVYDRFNREDFAEIVISFWLKGFRNFHPLDLFGFELGSASLYVRHPAVFKKNLLLKIENFFSAGGIDGNTFSHLLSHERVAYVTAHRHIFVSWILSFSTIRSDGRCD